ncbi:TM221 protein, partial [Acrocephalus arundinaceus]|nr:TM221 protein [Acrocephalus arundinaceus]
ALALSMLLLFQLPAGIASACILTSGILVLLLSVLHALLRASQISQMSQISQRSSSEPSQALYENDSARPGENSDSNKTSAPAPQIHREFSFPIFLEGKSRPGSASSSNPSSVGSPRSKEFQEFQEFQREWQDVPRTHRTLSADSGLLREQGKPWNVITREMRNAMSRKATGKDSTLV